LNADATSPSRELADLARRGIGLLASHREAASAGEKLLRERYTFAAGDEATTLVALGGDGFMLHTLHRMLEGECPTHPVFGMNLGTLGFLMNDWQLDGLADRISGAKAIRVAPLEMRATTVGGGPAFLVQELFGPEWSLRFATVVFVVGGVLATKIPRVRIEQSPQEARLEKEELHQPSILLAGSAMAVMRGAVGFLAFFAAFSLKSDLFALGVAATMAVIGGFIGNIAGPPIRRMLREEQMLAASLLATASVVLIGALLSGDLAFAVSSLAVAVGAASSRLAFDSLLQRDGPDAARGRAFARFETRFQVAWVVGALIGILPQNEQLGLLLLAIALASAGILYVGARRAARGREMRSTLRPEAVDRAVGRAARGVRSHWRARRAAKHAAPRPQLEPPPDFVPPPDPVPAPEPVPEPPEAFPGGS